MPWTKTNYPDSMKNLTATTRKKAIAIANAILKENKKMKEGKIIATAIKHAKGTAVTGVKKTKSVGVKKVKMPVKSKPKSVVSKKAKKSPRAKIKNIVAKKTKMSVKSKTKRVVGKEEKISPQGKTKNTAKETPAIEIMPHGEDLHFIHVPGELHPIKTKEAHQIENSFHHREEVTFHQENEKVKVAMATHKNSRRGFRTRGSR